MAFEDLLDWAANRYPWQQDALRRLALAGELTEDDLTALRLQIERAAGLAQTQTASCPPPEK